jgi:AraC family transcriptional regulator of arabinose operon
MTPARPDHPSRADAWHGWWLEPGSGGEFRCLPEWRVLPRVVEDYTFWFVRGGVGLLRCGHETRPMAAGDLLLVPPGVRHSAEHDATRPLWVITAHFAVRSASGQAGRLPPEALPPLHRHLREPHVFDSYFVRLLALRALRPPGWSTIAGALLHVLLAEVWREDAQLATAPALGDDAYPAIAHALLRLETDGRYFTSPSALAQDCGFSPAHFSRIFRRQFGCTPQHYLLRRRIERAHHLLLESDLSVRQIARSLGYRDVYFFSRQFKASVGQPPVAFRRGARPELNTRLRGGATEGTGREAGERRN